MDRKDLRKLSVEERRELLYKNIITLGEVICADCSYQDMCNNDCVLDKLNKSASNSCEASFL